MMSVQYGQVVQSLVTSQGQGAAGSESSLLDGSVVTTLVGFKDVSVNTLKANLGMPQAEAVTLSAIDRVLGLADESLVNDSKLASLEQKLMNTATHLLQTVNQTLSQRLCEDSQVLISKAQNRTRPFTGLWL